MSVCSKASEHYSSYTGVRGRIIIVGITGDEVVEYSNGSLVDVLHYPSGGLTGQRAVIVRQTVEVVSRPEEN